MDITNKLKLGDMLVRLGKITEEKLSEILKIQKGTSKRLGEILVEEKVITEDELLSLLEVQMGIQRIYLNMVSVSDEAIKKVPERLARRYCLVPLKIEDKKIHIAMNDPLDLIAIDDVRFSSGLDVKVYLASNGEIEDAITKSYAKQSAEKYASELAKQRQIIFEAQDKLTEKQIENYDEVKNAPAVRLVDTIVSNAVKTRCSDIHIEPYEKAVRVRYRIDGDLKEVLSIDTSTHQALVTRIKILSNMDIAEKRVPQDGRYLVNVEGKDVDLRVSVLPTINGEKVVIRLLNKDPNLIGIKNLNMFIEEENRVRKMIKSPYGIILITGPTGSGKSTTLYSLLKELNREETNISTIEDPVEFMFQGVNQTNVNVKAGMTFAAGLRSILRQDPDVIMIGEIRDGETAEIAIRSAITGHLVLSTLHTNDAASAVLRLIDMGVPSYLVASSITGVISQRLVKKICPVCKTSYEASEYEKRILGFNKEDSIKIYKGEGCSICNNTGFVGRTAIYEVMEITKEHRDYISKGKTVDDLLELSLKSGMKTLEQSAIKLVLEGVTTINELLKVSFVDD